MQFKKIIALSTIILTSLSAYIPDKTWTTLKPTGTYSGAVTDYPRSFGIAAVPVPSVTCVPAASASSIKVEDQKSVKNLQSSNTNIEFNAVSCKVKGALELHLSHSVLTDGHGRVGSIVSNHQFQFDGPPPQAGAIYAAGWGISPEGHLTLGSSDIFYQCLSGDFYNLYDEKVAEQCSKVYLQCVDLIDC